MHTVPDGYFTSDTSKIKPIRCIKANECVFNKWIANIKQQVNAIVITSQQGIDIKCYNYVRKIDERYNFNFYQNNNYPSHIDAYPAALRRLIVAGCSANFFQLFFKHTEELGGINKIRSSFNWLFRDAVVENNLVAVKFLIDWALQQESGYSTFDSNKMMLCHIDISDSIYYAIKNKNCELVTIIYNYIMDTKYYKVNDQHGISYVQECMIHKDSCMVKNHEKTKTHADVFSKMVRYMPDNLFDDFIIANVAQQELLIKSLLIIIINNDKSTIKFNLEQIEKLKILYSNIYKSLTTNLDYIKFSEFQLNTTANSDETTTEINLFNINLNYIVNRIVNNNTLYELPEKLSELQKVYPANLIKQIIKKIYKIKLGINA